MTFKQRIVLSWQILRLLPKLEFLAKDREIIHGWNRMKLLSKFTLIATRSREIEEEWQRIQQDAHNTTFAFQSGRGTESDIAYKKGVVDGIKWCLNRFS